MKNIEKEQKIKNINQELRKEILGMRDEDQEMLKSKYDKVIIRKNTERAREILRQYGWPIRPLVGEDGSNAFWLLVQHSDHDAEFQKEALRLLEDAVQKGEASKRNLAYLIDRVRINSGEPQVFGTQFQRDILEPRPIEDRGHLEERRKEFGLETFEEYRKIMKEARSKEK